MLDDPESEDNKSECSMEEIYTVDVIYHGRQVECIGIMEIICRRVEATKKEW